MLMAGGHASMLGIYGGGGFGREVAAMAVRLDPASRLMLIDDDPTLVATDKGPPVVAFETFVALPGDKRVIVAIASARVRVKLAAKLADAGIPIETFVAASAILLGDCTIGAGSVIAENVVVSDRVALGESVHVNFGCYVAHDCVIGDYVTFAPHACCNGTIEIGPRAYIGAGAVLKNGVPGKPLRIGAGAVVGMGAVVTKDIPEGVIVVGNPAKPIKR